MPDVFFALEKHLYMQCFILDLNGVQLIGFWLVLGNRRVSRFVQIAVTV